MPPASFTDEDAKLLTDDAYGLYPRGFTNRPLKDRPPVTPENPTASGDGWPPLPASTSVGNTVWKRHQIYDAGQFKPELRDFGTVYINETTHEAVYVPRGSWVLGDWTITDARIALGMSNKARIADAIKNVESAMKELPEYKFFTAAHSLGGVVSKGISKKLSLYGVAFNSPNPSDVSTPYVMDMRNANDALAGKYGVPAPNAIVLDDRRPYSTGLSWDLFFSNPGQWFNDFFGNVEKTHGVARLSETRNSVLGRPINVQDSLTSGSETQQLLADKLCPQSATDATTYIQDGVVVTGSDSRIAIPETHLVYKYTEAQGATDLAGFGVSWKIPFDEGDAFQKFTTSFTQFFNGSTQQDVTRSDGTEIGCFNRAEDGSLTPVGEVPPNPPSPVEPVKPPTNEPVPLGPPSPAKAEPELSNPPAASLNQLATSSVPFASTESTGTNPEKMTSSSTQSLTWPLATPQADTASLQNSIRALAGTNCETEMRGAFELFLQTSHPSVAFFAKAVQVAGSSQITFISRLFGQWIPADDAKTPGDIVRVDSPFLEDASAWGVIISYAGANEMEVLVCTNQYQASIMVGLPATITAAWRPTYQTFLEEDTPQGKFWGPMMIRFKQLLERTQAQQSIDDFLSQMLRGKFITQPALEVFEQLFAKEFVECNAQHPPTKGDFVLSGDGKALGVMLTAGKVYGMNTEQALYRAQYINLDDFPARFYWHPRAEKEQPTIPVASTVVS